MTEFDKDASDQDVRRFVLRATKQRVAYLKYVKSRGYSIDDAQLAEFEEEIRIEEESLGESEQDTIGKTSVAELQLQLAFVDLFTEGSPSAVKALLLQLGHTKVRMHAEHNHERPHFHVEYKKQYSASYAVDTLARLAGQMPRKYEDPVLEWASKHRRSLAATWIRLKAGDDVREIVIVAESG
jgi:hypothetical protein